jgi:hypothetical protein
MCLSRDSIGESSFHLLVSCLHCSVEPVHLTCSGCRRIADATAGLRVIFLVGDKLQVEGSKACLPPRTLTMLTVASDKAP